MKYKTILLFAISVILWIPVITKAQQDVPASATELVFPDAEAKILIETLKPDEKKSLRNLNKIFVTADRVTRDLITQGFKIDDTIKSIETSLNNAGIKTVEFDEFKKMRDVGFPFLKIKFEITQDQKDKNSYSGLVKIALTQRVFLSRFTNTTTTNTPRPVSTSVYYPDTALVFAETWHTQKPIINKSREDVARIVVDIIVNEFIKDYKQANPSSAKVNN